MATLSSDPAQGSVPPGGAPKPILAAPSPAAIARAAAILGRGGLVAMPTETVYGLAASATCGAALARIFEIKNRPRFNPLIVHMATIDEARRHGLFTEAAEKLAAAFWPGPLTLVLKRRTESSLSLLASAGLETIAMRIPNHPVALALLAKTGPLAAPSANISGRLSPTTAAHVAAELGDGVEMILDGGAAAIGLESAIVDCTASPSLLRKGGIPREALEKVVGPLALETGLEAANETVRPRAPGQLLRHYAPKAPLRLNATSLGPNEALLSFGSHRLSGAVAERNLSPGGDLREAAANLFAMLRELDQPGISAIAVMPIPVDGLGAAINDRLRRGAAGKEGR